MNKIYSGEKVNMAIGFAQATPSCASITIMKNGEFYQGFAPRLNGKFVSIEGMSFHKGRRDAIKEAKQYKALCIDWLMENWTKKE